MGVCPSSAGNSSYPDECWEREGKNDLQRLSGKEWKIYPKYCREGEKGKKRQREKGKWQKSEKGVNGKQGKKKASSHERQEKSKKA